MTSSSEGEILQKDQVIRERWKINQKIGGGGFGEIYEAEDLQCNKKERIAIKVESSKASKQVLKMEVAVLRRLQGKHHACKFYGCGRNESFNYLVMEKLGKNLADLRRESPRQCFSVSTALRVSMQILDAIQEVHSIGFLHRDIKPSNFAIGIQNKKKIYILDFGLARLFLNGKNEIRAKRTAAGFRGTVRYASLTAHQNKEMGRHDDLWSLFYMLLEFMKGWLPWRRIKDKEEVGKMKLQFEETNYAQILSECPFNEIHEIKEIPKYLKEIEYDSDPKYILFSTSIKKAIKRLGINWDEPFDWENAYENLPHSSIDSKRQHKIVDQNTFGETNLFQPQICSSTIAIHAGFKSNEKNRQLETQAPTIWTEKEEEEDIVTDLRAENSDIKQNTKNRGSETGKNMSPSKSLPIEYIIQQKGAKMEANEIMNFISASQEKPKFKRSDFLRPKCQISEIKQQKMCKSNMEERKYCKQYQNGNRSKEAKICKQSINKQFDVQVQTTKQDIKAETKDKSTSYNETTAHSLMDRWNFLIQSFNNLHCPSSSKSTSSTPPPHQRSSSSHVSIDCKDKFDCFQKYNNRKQKKNKKERNDQITLISNPMRNSSRIEYLQNPRRKLSAHKIESKYLESCTILDNETMASPQSQSKSSGTSGLGTSGKTTTVATLPIQKSLENSDRKDANHRTHRTILFDCRSEAQSSSNENSSDKKRIFLDEMKLANKMVKSKGLKSGSPNITITSPKSQSIQLENENVFTGYNKKHLINEQMKKTESRLLNNGELVNMDKLHGPAGNNKLNIINKKSPSAKLIYIG